MPQHVVVEKQSTLKTFLFAVFVLGQFHLFILLKTAEVKKYSVLHLIQCKQIS